MITLNGTDLTTFKPSSVFSICLTDCFYNDTFTGCIVKVECLTVCACGAGLNHLIFPPSNSGSNYSS